MSNLAEARAAAPFEPEEDPRALERFAALSPHPTCLLDAQGRVEQANPAFERELGVDAADLIGSPLLDRVHPDDREATRAALASFAASRVAAPFEGRFRRGDGAWANVEWSLSALPGDRVYASARDVTAQRRVEAELADREARLSAVVDSAHDAIITIDATGTIHSFNLSAERIFGWTAAEVLGQNVRVLMPEPDHSRHDGYLRRYLETGEPHILGINRGREVVGVRKDGTTCALDLAVTEVRGDRRAFVGILRDISEKKKAEGMRNALLAREAHQLGRLEMAAGMLHDLGNALTGIGARAVDAQGLLQRAAATDELGRKTAEFLRANAPALEKEFGAAKAKALVDLVGSLVGAQAKTRADALESLAKLLAFLSHAQDLLAAHRSYSGAGSAAARERTRFEKILFDAQMMMSNAIAKRGGMITIDCAPHLPAVVVERSKLMQVLVNLVKNAGEAFDGAALERAPEITLAAAPAPEGGVTLEVRDNGPGFAPELGPLFFEEGVSTKSRGSGLGLGSARRMVESLGGTLELTSPGPLQGASARIHLPKELCADDDA
jgi:two-component system sensor kinase FixL